MLSQASPDCVVRTWHIVPLLHHGSQHALTNICWSLLAHLLQGHEEFDDEITLAGSGQVTPSDEVQHQLEHAADSPEGTATGPATSHEASGDLPQQAAPEDHQW